MRGDKMINIKIYKYGNEATITAEGNWKGIPKEIKNQIRKKENQFFTIEQAEQIKKELEILLAR